MENHFLVEEGCELKTLQLEDQCARDDQTFVYLQNILLGSSNELGSCVIFDMYNF